MEVINDDKITLLKDGVEKEYDLLFSFSSEDKMKTYIGYTDNSKNKEGKLNIYVSGFNPILGLDTLSELDEEELKMVDDVIKEIGGELK